MGRLFDLQIDFFKPVWRRVLLVAFCLCWAAVEFSNGAVIWGAIFGGLGLLALWQFFFDNWPASEQQALTEASSQAHSDSDSE